jgi:hypothetical protein
MKSFLKKKINEEMTKQLSQSVIQLFKFLQNKKKDLKTKKDTIEFFEKKLPLIGLPKEDAMRYYYLYTLNYRENGDYENISPEELKNEKDFPGNKITNVSSGTYAYAKMPFEGSNLRGYWGRDVRGVDQYIIDSYGWYPILVFKNNKWYSVSEKYSSSTAKQYGNVTRKGIYKTTQLRSKDLKSLVYGKTEEEIQNRRIDEFMDDYKEKLINSSFYGYMRFIINDVGTQISFDCRITNIELDGEKIIIDAEVKPKKRYDEIELNEEQKNEVEKNFSAQVFLRTKILEPNDVKISVKYVQ